MQMSTINDDGNPLENLRLKIDVLDHEIIGLLKQRQDVSKEIGCYKKQATIAILQSNREEEKMMCLTKIARELDIQEDYIFTLFSLILQNSRAIQNE
jgi:chorismate mutase